MSDLLLQQLPALLGVVVGGTATFVTTSLADRAKWRRERRERWDAARMQVYTEFGDAVKQVFNLATRIAAGKGFPHAVDPIEPSAQAIAALGEAESARARAWEAVLLLGDPATVDAARAWWHEVWRFVWFARGWETDPEQWPIAVSESDAARQRYYDCARNDLGVGGTVAVIAPPGPRWFLAYKDAAPSQPSDPLKQHAAGNAESAPPDKVTPA